MSRRKKKLYARRYQPWWRKKAKLAQDMEDALAPRFDMVGMDTGRASSSQMNMQNITRKVEHEPTETRKILDELLAKDPLKR